MDTLSVWGPGPVPVPLSLWGEGGRTVRGFICDKGMTKISCEHLSSHLNTFEEHGFFRELENLNAVERVHVIGK